MSHKVSNSKKNYKGYIQENDEKLVNNISTCFLIYMLTIYPLFMHDGYFDITFTKYTLLRIGITAYGILAAIAVIMLESDKYSYKNPSPYRNNKKKSGVRGKLLATDLAFLMFLLSGILAFLNSPSKSAAYSGINGRRCGLQFMLLMTVMYIFLSYGYKLSKLIFPVFAFSSAGAFILAILQHLDFDVFWFLARVKPSQKDSFISTFGNINTFAGFICISLPVFMTLYMFADKLCLKILYGVVTALSFAAIIASDSDCAYAGCGAAIIALLFVAIYTEKKLSYLETAVIGALGYTLMAVITKVTGNVSEKISGLSLISTYVTFLLLITAAVIIVYILCKLISKSNNKKDGEQDRKKQPDIKLQMFIAAAVIVIFMFSFIIYGIRQEFDLFTFDDSWGTYRGFVWSRLIEIYKNFSIKDKLIGFGNETVQSLMMTDYYDEMMSLTGTVYDNAHNEYLQYLVTMGLFGVISFVALLITSVVNCFKHASKSPVLIALAISIISYAAQAVFNVNQAVTTPYLFLFISASAGIIRYGIRHEEGA